jgi:hypothetical protein
MAVVCGGNAMRNRKSNRKHIGEGSLLFCVLLLLASAFVTDAAQAGQTPRDLKLDGNQETFTITVAYDTRSLYGTVSGSREVTICRE